MGTCRVEGCERKARARGLCQQHSAESREIPCSVPGCENFARARKLCSMHYYRWQKTGDPGEAARRNRGKRPCRVTDCKNDAITRDDLCPTHRRRKRLYGDENGSLTTSLACAVCGAPAMHGAQTVDRCEEHAWDRVLDLYIAGQYAGVADSASGYVYLSVRKRRRAAHRLVMERHLGRPLLPHETPHHLNGDRTDNRLSNLELWSFSQPAGQRIEDKVAWAVELLRLYAPHHLKEEST